MVQKHSEAAVAPIKRRGRPRAYDPDTALAQAMETFWKSGYAGTSLDDLSAATGMNRPSLYAAFGDKRDIYVKAYGRYRARMREDFRPMLKAEAPARLTLRKVFEAACALYLSGPDGPRGCFSVVTAASEAIGDPEIRKMVVEAIAVVDETFTALFAKAVARGELAKGADPAALAKIATATLHTLAVRARAGVAEGELNALIDASVALICGPESAKPRHRQSR
jgi:TetR/AcrR family transcriptional regulator, copper-responsive repressor